MTPSSPTSPRTPSMSRPLQGRHLVRDEHGLVGRLGADLHRPRNPKHKEDAEDFFKANEAEMLEGTAVLWEEKLPYYALMVMRVSEGEASFSSEIQNEPIDPENCAFAEEWFDFYDDGQLPPDSPTRSSSLWRRMTPPSERTERATPRQSSA